MKALVTYYSDTGNTKKLAQAVYEGIERAEKEILPLSEVKDTAGYDVIFFGFPVHSHSVPGKAEAFLKSVEEGKKLALFATHGSLRGGELAITAFYYAISLVPRVQVIGTFGCRGAVKPSVIEGLMKKLEHQAWAMEAQSAASHPDDADLADGREWAKWMMGKARAS